MVNVTIYSTHGSYGYVVGWFNQNRMFGLPSLKQILVPDIPGSMELSIHFGVQACVHIKYFFWFPIPSWTFWWNRMVNDSNPRTLYKLYPIKSQSNTIFPSSIPINHTFWLINPSWASPSGWVSWSQVEEPCHRPPESQAGRVFGGKQGFDQWTDMFF